VLLLTAAVRFGDMRREKERGAEEVGGEVRIGKWRKGEGRWEMKRKNALFSQV